ncbi:MAG: FAD-dependent oxidoreductase [Spirochaetaceae bacterium]|jgi:thioredoxin reductase (NADPH)|nr:FAD-dependent oxidoreductase [Spirochaetaceae bacterium]
MDDSNIHSSGGTNADPLIDLLIIGAGPAGLSAAQYGARANLAVLVLEQMAPGGQALNIEILENYPGNTSRGELPARSGYEFSQDLHKQAETFGARFIMKGAAGITKEGVDFAVTLSGGKVLRAPAVVLATGTEQRKLDIPGEAEFYGRGVSYCAACDGPFFKSKRIMVVGGGDAACDEAQYLSRLTEKVILIHRKSMFRAQRALAERALANPRIEVRFNTRLLEIKGETKVTRVQLEEKSEAGKDSSGGQTRIYEEPMDAVFIFAGSVPHTAPVKDLGVTLDEAGYVLTDQNMASSVPGLFAAGDVRSTPFRQVVVAAGEGAVAAHCAAAYLDNLKGVRYH